jgi:hypothetical protein
MPSWLALQPVSAERLSVEQKYLFGNLIEIISLLIIWLRDGEGINALKGTDPISALGH